MSRERAAFEGLGDLGSEADANDVDPAHYRASPLTVRLAAARAFERLTPLSTVEPFIDWLVAEATLRGVAVAALQRRRGNITVKALVDGLKPGGDPAAYAGGVVVAARLPLWEAIEALLRLASLVGGADSGMVSAGITARLASVRQIFQWPSKERLARLDALRLTAEPHLDESANRNVRGLLQYARGFAV
jgi:hypothetical protein